MGVQVAFAKFLQEDNTPLSVPPLAPSEYELYPYLVLSGQEFLSLLHLPLKVMLTDIETALDDLNDASPVQPLPSLGSNIGRRLSGALLLDKPGELAVDSLIRITVNHRLSKLPSTLVATVIADNYRSSACHCAAGLDLLHEYGDRRAHHHLTGLLGIIRPHEFSTAAGEKK
jgi:hypothetical protein